MSKVTDVLLKPGTNIVIDKDKTGQGWGGLSL